MSTFALLSAYRPEDVLATGGDRARTAHDFAADALAIAAQLRSTRGEVLLACADRYHLAVAAAGVWQAGLRVALPPNGREETLRELAPSVALILSDVDGVDVGLDLRPWLTGGVTQGAAEAAAAPVALADIASERALLTLYTSGSTGAPMACAKTAAQILGEAMLLTQALGFDRDTRVLATVPAHHIYGLLFSVLAPLAAGGSFVRDTPLHARAIEHAARVHGATALVGVPAHLHALAQSNIEGLGGVRQVYSSGAPLVTATAMRLHARFGVEVTEVLGSTETGGMARRHAHMLDARFTPMPYVQITRSEDGCLQLQSPLLDVLVPQPYACPDRIALHDDGTFQHLGRMDGVVKVGGTRVALPALEARVLAMAGVEDAAAVAVDATEARGQEIWLAVAVGSAAHLDGEAVRAYLLRWYEPVALPRRIRVVASLSREATGKLPRAALLSLFDRAPSSGATVLEVFSRDARADHVVARLRVPETYAYFEGHFAGDPLLPGVVQLDALALDETYRQWPELGPLRTISRLKFKRPIRPGDALQLSLARRSTSRVDFSLHTGDALDQVCAQGTLEFEVAP